MQKLVNGELIEMTQEEIDSFLAQQAIDTPVEPPAYIALRVAAYPSIPDQLDLIYKDKVNGTNLWITAISSVKAEYPKPVSTS